MGGDGAEGTATKAPTMDVYRVTDHVVGGDALAFVFRMRLTGVGQVVRSINFLSGHRGIGRIDHDEASIDLLQQALGMHHIRLLLDVSEVLCL